MATDNLATVVLSLTPQEQEAVLQFIDHLKLRNEPGGSQLLFMHAAEEFIALDSGLVERLAR